MFYILAEDVDKIQEAVGKIIAALGNGAKRIDKDINLGDDLPSPLHITGYWVPTAVSRTDVMRIDIKIKR
jgi:hypothetical protein